MSNTIKAKVVRISEGWVTVGFTAPIAIPGVVDETPVEFEWGFPTDTARQYALGDEVELTGLAITVDR